MKHFLITLFNATDRIERNVIAQSSTAALCIGIRMMGELQGPCGITCKIVRHTA